MFKGLWYKVIIAIVISTGVIGCFSSNSKKETVIIVEEEVVEDIVHERVENLTCLAHEPPVLSSNITFENAYPNLELKDIIQVYRMPSNTQEWFLLERQGFVVKFDDDPNVSEKSLVLDISDKVVATYGELGLLSLAFHPDFESNDKVYLYYTYLDENEDRFSTISEFTFNHDTQTLVDEVSILKLRQYTLNHQGGQLLFGPDNKLYMTYGDDGFGEKSQELDDLYGKMIRINVDGDGSYQIPNDNPYVGVEGARGEIFARGFRNPWRWSFDKATGDIWLGDVGASNLEEVNKVVKGGNFGWPIKEGTSCQLNEGCEHIEDLIDPVLEYSHEAGWGAIIGGEVYRGTKIQGLIGKLIFADFSQYSQIISLEYDEDGNAIGNTLFEGNLSTPGGIRGFTSDFDGEIYISHYNSIHRMVPDIIENTNIDEFPQLLSETGCFSQTSTGVEVDDALVPYDVASSLYTDGAEKNRWMAIPDESEITVTESGDFIYPVGSVLIKEFLLGGEKIETRLLMKNDIDTWNGYTYEWNETQTEAHLLPSGKTVVTEGIHYQIPNRVQCQNCHNSSINGAIGPEFVQLNFETEYKDGVKENQIAYLTDIGYLESSAIDKINELTVLPDYHDAAIENEQRVGSFVHSNCAYCHNPTGSARGDIDFSWPIKEQWNACNKDPQISTLGIPDAKLIFPGQPEKSIIYKRLNTTESYQMPPIGRSTIQHEVVDLLSLYINNVECN